MRQAIKSKKKIVKAYQLGTGSAMEQKLIQEGVIIDHKEGHYELFSQESINGMGEIADVGDYFKINKINDKHYPYPNTRDWFETNHVQLKGNDYAQLNKPLFIWQATDPGCPEIDHLIISGKLTINENDPIHYFNAFLWGADLSAAKDATIVFYSIDKDEGGNITDISFNFVAKEQFEADYEIC